MALIEIDFHPDEKKLRSFATVAFIAAGVAAFALYAAGVPFVVPAGMAAVGLAVMYCSIVSPAATRVIYLAITAAAWPVGWIISMVLLVAIYYLVITPIAIIFRLTGRDELRLRPDRGAATYWRGRCSPTGPESYFRQS